LPWVSTGDQDNLATLAGMTWQVHVYGNPSAELVAWAARHKVPLYEFDWRPEHEAAGLARDALYLIRPDTYVALAGASGAPDVLDRYFAERQIAQ
jgi:hypothetical protein